MSLGNRNLCNLDDLAMAFDEYQIRLPSLQEYFNEVDQLPFPHEVYQFPVKRCSKHVYESSAPPTMTSTAMIGESSDEDDEALSPLIPAYLPPLPTKEETVKGYCCISLMRVLYGLVIGKLNVLVRVIDTVKPVDVDTQK